MAVTFDPHPEHFLRPAQAPQLMTPIAERLRLLAETGIDAVLVLPFDAALASLSRAGFCRSRFWWTHCGCAACTRGRTFVLDTEPRRAWRSWPTLGAELGLHVHVHEAVRVRGMEVSSSAIRALVAAGDMRRARWMLGRPFSVLSTPARGRGIGTRLLVPTVNLAAYDGLLPGFGVYVTRLKIGGRAFQAVTNVGNRPTFGEASFAVESHILNFEPVDMNEDTPLELEFLMRLRGEMEWPSPEALKAQILRMWGGRSGISG